MLTVKQFTNAQDAADYLLAKQQEKERGREIDGRTEDYYVTDGEAKDQGHWHGPLAASMGLVGVVDKPGLVNALRGCDASGQDQVEGAGSEKRKPGYDACFTVDKSISIAYSLATGDGKREMEEIIMAAHGDAMRLIAASLTCNRGKGGRTKVQVAELAYCTFMEFGSRANEPDLHIHTPIMNMALAEDGKVSCLDFEQLVASKHLWGALFRASIAKRFLDKGYAIESVEEQDELDHATGQVWHRFAGVEQDLCDGVSTRRKEILAYVQKHGGSKDAANYMTRAHKADLPYSELIGLQREMLAGLGATFDETALKGLPNRLIDIQGDDEFLIDRVHVHESFFTRSDLMMVVARYKGGHLDADGVVGETDRILTHANLVALKCDADGQERWASSAFMAKEHGLRSIALERQNDVSVHVGRESVEAAIAAHQKAQGFELNAEQLEAVRYVAYGSGAVACLTGRAGTGKSASIGAAVRAFQAEGRQVIGTAIGDKAARVIGEEAGVVHFNTALLFQKLDSGQLKLQPGAVLVLDESGMADTKTMHALLDRLNAPEVRGKLVAVGDYQQLQSVGPGAPHKLLVATVGERVLENIKRQKHEADREIALAMYGTATGAELAEKMEARGQIAMAADEAAAVEQLARRYVEDSAPEQEKIIIAPRHAQIAMLNSSVREMKKARGELAQTMTIKASAKGLGKNVDVEVGIGESVMFRKSGRDIDGKKFSNGDFGQVVALHDTTSGLSYDVLLSDGELLRLSTSRNMPLSYNYAGTVHSAQGQSKDHVYSLQTTPTKAHQHDKKDRNIEMVAFTRTKRRFLMVATEEGLAGFITRCDAWKYKQNASDLEKWEAATPERQETATAFGELVQGAIRKVRHPERAVEREAAPTFQERARAVLASVRERALAIRMPLPLPSATRLPTLREVLDAVDKTRRAAQDSLARRKDIALQRARQNFDASPEGRALARARAAKGEIEAAIDETAAASGAQLKIVMDRTALANLAWGELLNAEDQRAFLAPVPAQVREKLAGAKAAEAAERAKRRALEEELVQRLAQADAVKADVAFWERQRGRRVDQALDVDAYAVRKVARDWRLGSEDDLRLIDAYRRSTENPEADSAGFVLGVRHAITRAVETGEAYKPELLKAIDQVGFRNAARNPRSLGTPAAVRPLTLTYRDRTDETVRSRIERQHRKLTPEQQKSAAKRTADFARHQQLAAERERQAAMEMRKRDAATKPKLAPDRGHDEDRGGRSM